MSSRVVAEKTRVQQMRDSKRVELTQEGSEVWKCVEEPSEMEDAPNVLTLSPTE